MSQTFSQNIATETLDQFALFEGVSVTTRNLLLNQATLRRYDEDQYLIAHQDDSSNLICILSGMISVERIVDDRIVSIVQRGPGDILGELSCILGTPRSADARSVTEVTILKLTSTCVNRALDADICFARNMIELLATKLFQTVDATSNSSKRLLQKLALEIYSEFKHGKEKLGPSCWMLKRRVSQQEWAIRVGASRESVNRCLKQIAEMGLITHRDGRLCLLDKDGLSSLAS